MITLTVKETSDLTGWSPGYVRSACRRKIIGDSYCGGSGSRYTHVVSTKMLSDFTGMSLEEIENAVREMRKGNF